VNARYVDLPVEKLAHDINGADRWFYWRGRTITIDPHVYAGLVPNSYCDGPFFRVVGQRWLGCPIVACYHIIEIIDPTMEAKVEAVARELREEVGA
jgi:hypothetical protein